MGQKEKARAIVNAEYEFSTTSRLPVGDVLEQARTTAEGCKRGLGAGIRHHGDGKATGGQTATFSVRGPGGLVSLMEFVVVASPADGATTVNLRVGDFLYQKGSLGMKPTINAKSTMKRFVESFRAAL